MSSIKYTGIIRKADGTAFTMTEATAYINANGIDPFQHYYITVGGKSRRYWAKPDDNGSFEDDDNVKYSLQPEAVALEDYPTVVDWDDARSQTLSGGDIVWLDVNNNVAQPGGLIKLPPLIIFLLFSVCGLNAQILQRTTPPQYNPTIAGGQSFIWNDIQNKAYYEFKTPFWYRQGSLKRSSLPSDSTYTVGSVTIIIKYTDCRIYHTGTNSFWAHNGTEWLNEEEIIVNKLLARNNTWTGTNTFMGKGSFKDSLNTDKGMKSGGLVDTKGMKSEADTSGVAIESKGAIKGKYKLITANDSLDTKDFFIEVKCTTADIYIKCPPLLPKFKDVFYTIKRTDDTNYIVFFQRPDGSIRRILSKSSAILRYTDENNNWNFD